MQNTEEDLCSSCVTPHLYFDNQRTFTTSSIIVKIHVEIIRLGRPPPHILSAEKVLKNGKQDFTSKYKFVNRLNSNNKNAAILQIMEVTVSDLAEICTQLNV